MIPSDVSSIDDDDLLLKLASHHDPAIRRAVVQHAASDSTVFDMLACEFPLDVILHPKFLVLHYLDPHFLEPWENAHCLFIKDMPELYRHLVSTLSEEGRDKVAKNTSTPPDILTMLAMDEDWQVRWGVAMNTSTPPDILTTLAEDPDVDVRWHVAGNTSTPPDILKTLGKDPDVFVRQRVAKNPHTPLSTLKALAALQGDEWSRVRLAAKQAIAKRSSP